jgi:iron complex outermembrane recepter protein
MFIMANTKHLAVSASLLALAVSSVATFAQTTPATPAAASDDIIVTATKRSSTLQDVPFSINALTAEDIQRSGSTNLEDISRNVASLSIQNLGPGQSQVSIRGVSSGQIVRDQPGVKEQVGVYLDESVISLSLFTPDLDLFDLNRVEVLRGPQGTLFGSGSVGGTLRYITNQPNVTKTEGKIEGNFNLVGGDAIGGHIKGAVNVPLVEGKAALRAVGYYTRFGGFIDARREGGALQKNVNGGDRYGGRISVLFQPTENISLTPRVVYQKIKTNGFNRQEVFNLYANPFTTTRPAVTFKEREQFLLLNEAFEDETFLADLTASVDAGPVTLTSVTSYTNRDILVSRDASALTGSVSVDLGFPTAGVLLPSNLRDTTKLKQFTQEVRLASNDEGALQWVVGGYYANTKRDYKQRLPTPGYDAFTNSTLGAGTAAATANGFPANSPFNSDLPYDLTQYAAFGEATYAFTDQLKATAGVRYYNYKEKRVITTGGLFANGDRGQVDNTKSNGVSPRLILSFEANDALTVNAQISRGFRLGGVNDPLNVPLCTAGDRAIFGGFQKFGDEKLWNYELGVKGKAGGVRYSAAAFRSDIKDLQVTLDAGSCSSRIVFNVPKAHSQGVEFEVSGTLADVFDLSFSGTVNDAKFDSTVRDGTGTVIGAIRDGNRLPSVPQLTLALSGTYNIPLDNGANAFVGATVQHIGNRFTQPSDQENNPRSFTSRLPFGGATGTAATVVDLKLPAYQIINLNAGVDFDNGWNALLYVNNLLDKNALLSFDRERNGRARLGFSVGQPRTIGITVGKKF